MRINTEGLTVTLTGENMIKVFQPKACDLNHCSNGLSHVLMWFEDGSKITVYPGQYAVLIEEPSANASSEN